MDSKKVGEFISRERKIRNMTQAELAKKLNVTSQAISKWENGRGLPDIELLKSLSEIFEVNIEDLLNGNKNSKKSNLKLKYLTICLFIIIVALGIYLIKVENNLNFTFSKIASDNNSFNIKGVMAYNKSKKSIYISEIDYSDNDEPLYKDIECILYESLGNIEKKISSLTSSPKNNLSSLSELLKNLEFNIDDYDCSCNEALCDNLYLIIKATNDNNDIITYNIPLEISPTCN
ncbi:MAG: helix-turn-helix domain-containing protein [Ruminococcus sp.]|nr:helix-turn-helix domain-containing protein [Ruminococcus sp.]